jgi:O-antigen ligase
LPILAWLRRQLTPPQDLPADRRVGFWLFVGHLLTVWGLALSNGLMGLAMLWTIFHRRRLLGADASPPPPSWPRIAPLFVPAGLYVVVYVVSALTSVEPSNSLRELRDLLNLITFLLAPLWVRGETQVRYVLNLFLVMIVGLGLQGIGQYFLTDYGSLHHRIVGLFSHYQTFSGVLLLGTLTLAGRLATGNGWKRPLLWSALAVTVWTLLLSLTRGPWVAAAVILVMQALLIARWRVVLAGTSILVLCFAVLAPRPWFERVSSILDLRDVSNYDRFCMAEAATYMVSERPLFGIGPEVVKHRYPIYRHPTAPRVSVPHLHDTLLQRAAEQGLFGLTTYLWWMGASLWLAFRGYRREGPAGPRADLYLTVILVLVGFNVAGLFEDNWRDTEVQRLLLFFLTIPLCLVAGDPPDDEQSLDRGAQASQDGIP